MHHFQDIGFPDQDFLRLVHHNSHAAGAPQVAVFMGGKKLTVDGRDFFNVAQKDYRSLFGKSEGQWRTPKEIGRDAREAGE